MKLSNLIIEAAKRPEEIPAREWLVQDIELNPDSSSEILFIQSNKTYLLLEVLCGLRLALTGRIDAVNGPISNDRLRYTWLRIKHAVATMADDHGEQQLFPGHDNSLILDEFSHLIVPAGMPSLFEMLAQDNSRGTVSDLITTISHGSLTGMRMDSPDTLSVTTAKNGQIPYHYLSQGQAETVRAAVSLLQWKTGIAPILPLLLSEYETMAHDCRIAMVREACETEAAGQVIFLGTPYELVTLFHQVEFPVSVYTIS